MHLTLAGESLWRKQMSICGHKRAPVKYVILFFVFRGLCFWSVSIMKRFRRCADPCQHFWHQMTHTTYALGEEHARSVLEGMECVHCEPFSLGKLRSRLFLFSWELGRSSAPRGSGPAAAEAVRRLRSRRSQMELANSGLTRVNCWRKIYCLLHLLIQQDVLCWLMVGWWRRRGYFWAFSACLPHVCRAAGGYEACASARLDLQWRHEKVGVARSRLDERSLSGITSQLPWASPFLPDLHSETM